MRQKNEVNTDRIKRGCAFLNEMNQVLGNGEPWYVADRAKKHHVAQTLFQKACSLGVFPKDRDGKCRPRRHAIYAPTVKKILKVVEAYERECNVRSVMSKGFCSPAAPQQAAIEFAPVPETISLPEPEHKPIEAANGKIVETINHLREAGVKSAVMFVVEL